MDVLREQLRPQNAFFGPRQHSRLWIIDRAFQIREQMGSVAENSANTWRQAPHASRLAESATTASASNSRSPAATAEHTAPFLRRSSVQMKDSPHCSPRRLAALCAQRRSTAKLSMRVRPLPRVSCLLNQRVKFIVWVGKYTAARNCVCISFRRRQTISPVPPRNAIILETHRCRGLMLWKVHQSTRQTLLELEGTGLFHEWNSSILVKKSTTKGKKRQLLTRPLSRSSTPRFRRPL